MSAQRAKGTRAESAVVGELIEGGWRHAERRALHGANDRGDIAGVVGVTVSVKNCRETALAEWVDEVERQRATNGDRVGVVWHKRRAKARPADWYVTMSGATLMGLLREAGYL